MDETIFALSSGHGKAGVAVIRLSGEKVKTIIQGLTDLKEIIPRYAYFTTIYDEKHNPIDKGLILYFQAPKSFTGEDVAEFHIHGSMAIQKKLFTSFLSFENTRPAEAGEFSRRAVLNGKMDLTEAEGLMDLIHADTEYQRQQAYHQMHGELKELYTAWRHELKYIYAYLEAFIDFPEEEIPEYKQKEMQEKIKTLIQKIDSHLKDKSGLKIKSGFQIALMGKPNAGKSSFLNKILNKEAAIVSSLAGTTRDIIEYTLDIDGFPIVLADTAGLRVPKNPIEKKGIQKALKKASEADLIIYIQDGTKKFILPENLNKYKNKIMILYNKADLIQNKQIGNLYISAKTGTGTKEFIEKLKKLLHEKFALSAGAVITNTRYIAALNETKEALNKALKEESLELITENIRHAGESLGRITGAIASEELLDIIFKDFCIGK